MIPWKSRARCGARVIEHAWRGLRRRRRISRSRRRRTTGCCASTPTSASRRSSRRRSARCSRAAPPAAAAYAIARRNRFLGRWLAHGEGYPDWNVRLFDRRRARWTDDPVHEHVVADGPVARLRGDLLHASAESLDAYIAKQNRYTTLQAEAMHARGERAERARARAVAARALRPLLRAASSASSTASPASRTSRSARSRASSSTRSCARCSAEARR